MVACNKNSMRLYSETAWYCARTKARHEHIAAASVRRNLGLYVFQPRLRLERSTSRGLVRVTEPLFPGYIFVQCPTSEKLNDIRYANGVNTLLRFGDRIPTIENSVIDELREWFRTAEPLAVEAGLPRGTEVLLTHGPFHGLRALVTQYLPARQRVQVLLEILGRPTAIEIDRRFVARTNLSVADLMPHLATPQRQLLRA
jgi:transcriptional antiterminator RfaH